MGLGKTYVGAEQAVRTQKKVLLVCQKSKLDDWVQHFTAVYPDIPVFNLRNEKDKALYLSTNNPCIGCINYDLLWRRPELNRLKNFTLLLDESSEIQNEKAKRTKAILKLEPENVILLSGTPTSGKYENLWSQAHLLGWPITQSTFFNQYVNWEWLEIPGVRVRVPNKKEPYRRVDRLKAKLRQYGAQFLKTNEVFSLPDQTMIPVYVEKSTDYRKFDRQGVLKIGDETLTAENSLVKRLGLKKLCGAYSKAKHEALTDLLNSTNDRLIIFYNLDCELEILKQLCKDRPISEVNGHRRDLTAYETENDSVTLIQYQAGAMGLNLQKSNKIIYFTLPERSDHFEQSKKRIHRIGQDKPCFYYLLMVKDSVETDEILPTLKIRKDYTDALYVRN